MTAKFKTRIFLAAVLLVLTPALFQSCAGKVKKVNVEKIQQLTGDERWGIIVSPYATFYENPEVSKNSTMHGRKGDIVQIFGKRIQILEKDERMVWYKLENGWVSENDVFICTNLLQAEKYAETMKAKK